jgi:hypothetical protein
MGEMIDERSQQGLMSLRGASLSGKGGLTRMNGHDEDHVHAVGDLLRNDISRRVGRDGDTGLHASIMDLLGNVYRSLWGGPTRRHQQSRRKDGGR